MSRELELITSTAAKGYLDDFDIIKTILEHMSEVSDRELRTGSSDTSAVKIYRSMMSECGRGDTRESVSFGEMVEIFEELENNGDSGLAEFYSKWMLVIMNNTSKNNIWFRAFAAVSVNKLSEYLESELYKGCKPFKKIIGLLNGDKLTDKFTVGSMMGKLRDRIFESWTPGTSVDNYTQRITDCCEAVVEMVIGIGTVCSASAVKNAPKTADVHIEGFDDLIPAKS